MPDLETRIRKTGESSRKRLGNDITFYLPGMFIFNNMKGQYPALSITGNHCALQCSHCKGKLLNSMADAANPQRIAEQCRNLAGNGAAGVLLSGGCDSRGRLPWNSFYRAIEEIKHTTNLKISIHTGMIDRKTARSLKSAGVDQALIDIIGNRETYSRVYHLENGPQLLQQSLDAISEAGIDLVPHIVCGLNFGKLSGEMKAVSLASSYEIKTLVIVSMMPLSGTPMATVQSPSAAEIAEVILEARKRLPDCRISLGCARKRGDRHLELMAIRSGINGMTLPSDEAIEEASKLGLNIRYQKTCCSVAPSFATSTWN